MKRIVASGLLTVLPLLAHHSIRADYDLNKVVGFKGTITKVEFMNPHVRLFVDVAEPDGKVTNWVFEMLPPNPLKRLGMSKDSLKEGHQISLDGWVAKDGSKSANARTLTWPDGRTMTVGDIGDGWMRSK